MSIKDLLGYKFTCRMSKDLKNEPEYSEHDFNVIIYPDERSDSGYSATVSGVIPDGEPFSNEWDGEQVAKNIFFGTWDIISKEKIN